VAEPLTTEELHERLERRVCGPEGQGHSAYLFKEVCLDDRRVDAVSVGLWKSRGFKIEGFELKTNRRDWLKEFEDHGKAEPAMALCDHFWLVTNPGVLHPHELPDNWGLLLSAGRRRHLVVEKPAPKLHDEPVSIDRGLLANFIKHAASLRWQAEHEIREKIKAEERHGSDQDFKGLENRLAHAEDSNRQLRDAYEEFKRTSGFDFLRWSPDAEDLALLGVAAKAVKLGPAALRRMLKDIERQEQHVVDARRLLKETREALKEALP
jgi:hypothetical protein